MPVSCRAPRASVALMFVASASSFAQQRPLLTEDPIGAGRVLLEGRGGYRSRRALSRLVWKGTRCGCRPWAESVGLSSIANAAD